MPHCGISYSAACSGIVYLAAAAALIFSEDILVTKPVEIDMVTMPSTKANYLEKIFVMALNYRKQVVKQADDTFTNVTRKKVFAEHVDAYKGQIRPYGSDYFGLYTRK